MKLTTSLVINGVLVLTLIVFMIVNYTIDRPYAPDISLKADDTRSEKRCKELLNLCNKAIKELDDCSKVMHFITLGYWCRSEAQNAVTTCTSAREVCTVAKKE